MVPGLDQGLFIPSITILNGFRNSSTGFEVAVGPGISFASTAEGYYSGDEWIKVDKENPAPAGAEVITRVDRNGTVAPKTYVVMAVGKTLTQGRLNIPFNVYAVPSSDGWRFGFSVGFNSKS
jgi:hypothetical protein